MIVVLSVLPAAILVVHFALRSIVCSPSETSTITTAVLYYCEQKSKKPKDDDEDGAAKSGMNIYNK